MPFQIHWSELETMGKREKTQKRSRAKATVIPLRTSKGEP